MCTMGKSQSVDLINFFFAHIKMRGIILWQLLFSILRLNEMRETLFSTSKLIQFFMIDIVK